MLRTALLVCLLSGSLLPALAQQDSTNNTNGMNGAAEAVPVDSIYVRGTDTLHYTYTPAPAAATASVPVASDSLPRRRPSFLRRIVNYFGESTTDKTFEKKIDFTFAGVPATRKHQPGHRRTGRRTLPARPERLGHLALERLHLCQRLHHGLLRRGRHGQQHLRAEPQPHRLLGGLQVAAARHLGSRVSGRSLR